MVSRNQLDGGWAEPEHCSRGTACEQTEEKGASVHWGSGNTGSILVRLASDSVQVKKRQDLMIYPQFLSWLDLESRSVLPLRGRFYSHCPTNVSNADWVLSVITLKLQTGCLKLEEDEGMNLSNAFI